jgi:hypothetical protein
VRRQSKKRAALIRVYLQRREVWLLNNPWCVRCGGEATEIHHAAGRIAGRLIDVSGFRAMCHDCHVWATEHPKEAIARGFSLPRVGGDVA